MAYEKPGYTLNQIDKAGKRILGPIDPRHEIDAALIALWNWRLAHSYPLNAIHMTLKNRATKIDKECLTAQRLKRYDSIIRKLHRQPSMQMSQMQDIGGCRAIISGISALQKLMDLYAIKPTRHTASTPKNYVSKPKEDGYRGVHLMYRFIGSGSSAPWNKLRIEIQLRTKIQHAWATAVETVDAFTGENLKFGLGSPHWRRFFALVGSVHAVYENMPTIPGTPTSHKDLSDEIRSLEKKLGVIQKLKSYADITKQLSNSGAAQGEWYLVIMKPEQNIVKVDTFSHRALGKAQDYLSALEQQYIGSKNQAVLVSADSLSELQKAYPNYFADTEYFMDILNDFLEIF